MAKHEDHETGSTVEGNAGAALKAISGVAPEFKDLNTEPGSKWGTEGNAAEAIAAIGGVGGYSKITSVVRHGPVELPGANTKGTPGPEV